MFQKRLVSLFLSTALLISLPAATAAQSGGDGPEGVDWALTGYLVDDELVPVPIGVDATLRLEDGVVSGSGGCNTFSGSYELDGESLTFDEEMVRTLRACVGDADDVEGAYLSLLLTVDGWELVGEGLELSNVFDDVVLTFEVPGGALTSGDLAVLVARLDAMEIDIEELDQRLDNIKIGVLRDRIKALEEDNTNLQRELAQLRPPPGTTAAFNAAERVLLEGVPTRIANRCQPLRSGLPTGTAAAVQCSPNTSLVTEMAYYLMDKGSAVKLYDKHMKSQGLQSLPDLPGPEATGCWEGNPGYSFAPGGYVGGIGCYVKNGKANLRIIQQVTDCKQLKVGTKQLKRPVMYVGLTGADDDILALREWALRDKPNLEISGVVKTIQRPGGKPSPNCF